MSHDASNSRAAVDALRGNLRGSIIGADDSDFRRARSVWNGAIDREPAAIVVCDDAEDVAICLRTAADHGAKITIRCGGHNVAGRSLQNGALLLDLSRLRQVTVHPATRSVTVQGGALWRDIDLATTAHGLATTGGVVSSTGVGGFTLGGGVGWLMRRHGLAIDNLSGARVVLADGRTVWASAEEHEDLYWGLRGGAGGLGVVTTFDFRLHPLEQVLMSIAVYRPDAARSVLTAFRDFAAQAPDEFCGLAALVNAPPLPFLDPAWQGRPVVLLASCWCGDPEVGAQTLLPLQNLEGKVAAVMHPMPYADWQQLQDAGAPAGRHQYWKTANYATLDDATLDLLAAALQNLPSPESEIHLQHMGGAVARVPSPETAFAHRSTQYFINVLGVTHTPSEFGSLRERVRALHAKLSAGALDGQMPNFGGDGTAEPDRVFGKDHARRLLALRRQYDPQAMFAAGE